MVIATTDFKRFVDIGSYSIWHSLYSTVISCLRKYHDSVPDAISFLQTGQCRGEDAEKTAKQLNIVHDLLASLPPESAIYDIDNPQMDAPWKNKISPIVTSCANLYTTADGKDLLFELVNILTYSSVADVSVAIPE